MKLQLPHLFILIVFLLPMQDMLGQNQNIAGTVKDWAGLPFVKAMVTLQNEDDRKDSVMTDTTGAYKFTKLKDGVYQISAKSNQIDRHKSDYVILNNGASKMKDIQAFRKSEGKEGKVKTDGEYEPGLGKRSKRAHLKTRNKQVSRFTVRNVDGKSLNVMPNKTFYSNGYIVQENAEDYARQNENGLKNVMTDPLSTFSIDVDRASYSNFRRFVNFGSLPPKDAVRIEEFINYFEYNYPQPTGDEPFGVYQEYTVCPCDTSHRLVHIGIQGKKIKRTFHPAGNFVFLIDVSGSMADDNKLPLLKSSLRLLTKELRSIDKVSIVVYAGAAGLALPPTPGDQSKTILSALEELNAGGSTAGGEGILLAYKTAKQNFISNGNNRVILATDGDFNVGVQGNGELEDLIALKRKENIFLTVLGFGTGNLKDSKMETLANKGNGNYAYIDNLQEAKKTLVTEMGGTLLVIAKDVKLQVEFNPARVHSYRLIGYENRVLNNEDFADDKKDAGEIGAGHTVTAMYEIIPRQAKDSTDKVLRYHTTKNKPELQSELLNLKIRYKDPTANSSKLLTYNLTGWEKPLDECAENIRFSSCVAEFGLILRSSEHKGKSNFDSVIARSMKAISFDPEGYRAEFIRLVKLSKGLRD